MKHRLITNILTVVVILLTVGCQRTQVRLASNPEEIRELNQQVLKAANESPDSALLMINSLSTSGTLPDYRCDFLRAKIYAQSLDSLWLDSAIIIGERLMTLDVTKEDMAYRQDVLEMLVNACRQHGDDEQAIHWCTQLIDLCRQQGDATVALRNEAELGCMLAGIGKTDEGLAKIDNAIQLLSADRKFGQSGGGKMKFNEMDACIIALRRKESVLDKEGRYSDIPPVAQAMLDLLADYEQHPDEFHDGSYREVTEEQRPGYIEFYRAKAYMYMAYAYVSLNEKVKAYEYLRLFERCAFAKTLGGRTEIAPTWCLLGEYDKMAAAYGEYEALLREQGDTINATYAGILRDRAKAAKAQGRYAESLRLHKQYETLTETLNNRLLRSKAHLYAARYHAQEQQQEIERQKAYKRYVSMMAFLIGILAIMGIFFAWYAARQWRKTQLKNRVLAQQIKEAMIYKEKYDNSTVNSSHSTIPEVETGGGSLDSLSPEELFHYIEHEVSRRLLFLNPSFDRQAIIDEFHISKERVGAAFSQGSKYDSMTQFVSDLRLEYASKLLVTTDLSITDIMTQAGFSNASVFSRYFSRKYQITPTQYRRANSKQT